MVIRLNGVETVSSFLLKTISLTSDAQETAAKMLVATVPQEHQTLGRQVKGYNGEKWNASKYLATGTKRGKPSSANRRSDKSRIVEEGNWWKFTSSKEHVQLKRKLLETGDRELVEVWESSTPEVLY